MSAYAGDDPRIKFHGFRRNVASAMEHCDVIALPHAGTLRAGLSEAMAASRPVLTTRTDGLASHVSAGAVDIGENSI